MLSRMFLPLMLLSAMATISTSVSARNEQAELKAYDLLPGFGYYKMYTVASLWTAANDVCESEGAYLHIINSEAELEALFAEYNHVTAWVGVNRAQGPTDDDFLTVFGKPLNSTGYSTWYPGFPQGTYQTDPYLVIERWPTPGLVTQPADINWYFICEMDLQN